MLRSLSQISQAAFSWRLHSGLLSRFMPVRSLRFPG